METKELDPAAEPAIREQVREHYRQSALRVINAQGCCGSTAASTCCSTASDPITSDLYDAQQAGEVPAEALQASLGCGNPTALAGLRPGEVVLDLGSGGGIDVLLAAQRVGPTGFAYGLDMTDEMLALAESNRRKAGATNVQFLKGYIESIPLPDNTVDVIISNCVINLAADKRPVLREAFRVLKPGGRFAVSDVVAMGEVPAWLRRSIEAWAGCVAGALHEAEYRRLLAEAGFTDIGIDVTRRYTADDVAAEGGCCTPDTTGPVAQLANGLFASGYVHATKPAP